MRCVRPDFTRSLNSPALDWREPSSCSSAGSRSLVAVSSAARCTADGNTSFDDCPMFTWSLGWTPSPASAASTSLAFMFEEVPEPVWNTSIGNCSSYSPSATWSAAAAIRSATSPSISARRRPSGAGYDRPRDEHARQGLAAGGGAPDAREQPPPRRRREAVGAGRLRRDRQGGAQLAELPRDHA